MQRSQNLHETHNAYCKYYLNGPVLNRFLLLSLSAIKYSLILINEQYQEGDRIKHQKLKLKKSSAA